MLNFLIRQTTEYKKLLAAANAKACAVALFGLTPIARAHVVTLLCEDTKRTALIVCEGEGDATRFCENAAVFGAKSEVYPVRDYVFRSVEGQSHEYEYRRLSVLGNIVGKRTSMVCAPLEAVLQYTIPKHEFCDNTLTLKKGDSIKQSELTNVLVSAGYLRRGQVEGAGQFSVRGGIVDIFAPDMQKPCRMEFWGDEIESIHTFDALSQRREETLRKVHLSPAREVLFSGAGGAAALLRSALGEAQFAAPEGAARRRPLLDDIKKLDEGILPTSMDKYLNVRYEKAGTVLEYLEKPIIFFSEYSAVRDAYKAFEMRYTSEIQALFEEGILCKELGSFYVHFPDFLAKAEKNSTIISESFMRTVKDVTLSDTVSATTHSLPPWGGGANLLIDEITPLVKENYSVAILAGTKRAAAALAKDISAANISATAYTKSVNANTDAIPAGTVGVLCGKLTAGVQYPFAKLAIFTSRQHAGENTQKTSAKSKNKGLSSLSDITPGDYVVHQNHGIGVYAGTQRLDLQGVVKDYLKITYSKGDTLYVPVTQLDIVSRYTAPGDSENIKLSRLGGDAWAKTKSKVRIATQEMAKELIELYAKRERAVGHAFPEDSEWQRDFETRFAYDETDDQLRSAHEIKKDMQRPQPMDRLLCGDVGVGKTEVALRAAFKCIMGGKQCAILVPTTILAWQHYNSIISRMEAFPVKTGLLSRFRTPTQQKATIRGISAGTVDIVVGTHRLIQKDVKFKNLGLVIVDEEQRFGVKHKERLKEMFLGVDMLTLSATPIPRTLNMALTGLRDMSTIDKPPIERLPVETYVLEYDDIVIAGALKKELGRGGQVYYLHNRVETIESCAAKVASLAPEAKVGIAHGRMDENALSRIWQQLMDGEIDVLVCTTLIETGVDVRNCNTLIVENADYMGLSQLYQLRGRVGRSGRKAYAYFTFRRDKVLTDIAAKRLSAIREFTSFGSGFRIAMRDLQIRGAGNLLGQSQHGHMQNVGYDMYVKLLNSAISQQKGQAPTADKSDCLIDVTVDAFIPESYIKEPPQRIEAYKLIAAIQSKSDADDVREELQDRYGNLPKSVSGLISISVARIVASQLFIYEITQKKDNILLYSDKLTPEILKPLMAMYKGRILVNAGTKPYISLKVLSTESPVDCMEVFLESMSELQEK